MPKAISLFSGCGGCSLGLRQAGFEIVLAVDIDVNACNSYAMNLGSNALWHGIDLAAIRPEVLLNRAGLSPGHVDLIVGGPPCQSFSSAGARNWDDPRTALLRRFVELVIAIRPTWFIMENVEGLLTAHGGDSIIEAITRFLAAGYWVKSKKIYLSAAPTEFIHPIENRLLTLRECARIQSFPDGYEFCGSWSSIATQIGNAIPPLFMQQLGEHLQKIATWSKKEYTQGHWLGMNATKSVGFSPALAHMLQELERRTTIYVR